MTLTRTQHAALKLFRDSALPLTHRTAENPTAPHHKTIEGLANRLLIEPKGIGYAITTAGKTALERSRG